MSKPQLNRTYNVVCYLCGRPDLSVGRGRAVNHREGGHGSTILEPELTKMFWLTNG